MAVGIFVASTVSTYAFQAIKPALAQRLTDAGQAVQRHIAATLAATCVARTQTALQILPTMETDDLVEEALDEVEVPEPSGFTSSWPN
jgi:hypothetical protein